MECALHGIPRDIQRTGWAVSQEISRDLGDPKLRISPTADYLVGAIPFRAQSLV
jgi:hypothetical protein